MASSSSSSYAKSDLPDDLLLSKLLKMLGPDVVNAIQSDQPSSSTLERGRNWNEYLPLHRATLRGEWAKAEEIFNRDPEAIKSRITFNLETPLHVAVGTGKAIGFVEKLVEKMSDELLDMKEFRGYTALNIAAMAGNTAAAKILLGRRPDLVYIASTHGLFPIHIASLYAHREALEYLLLHTSDDVNPNPYAGVSGAMLLNAVIDAEFFDIAIELAKKYPDMAKRKSRGYSALHKISLKNSAFLSGSSFNLWERFIYSRVEPKITLTVQRTVSNTGDIENPVCPTPFHGVLGQLQGTICKVLEQLVPQVKNIRDRKMINHQALELVKCLCEKMEHLSFEEASLFFVDPMVSATCLGINEVIEAIIDIFPSAINSQDASTNQYIFHLAVRNRCEKVYNLIYQMSDNKYQFSELTDSSDNTLLHLAAKLAPSHKLNLVSGAALQMQREIQWFKEVEKFVPLYMRKSKNKDGKTPKMIFTQEHKDLKVEGEKWMKDTANSCSIAAALIATVVFAAAITVPGGNQSDSGFPVFSKSSAFIVFAISDAISLFTSSTSLLMFLSVLTSRYAEEDFVYALPKRLCMGLFTLFVSILFMMAAFSATLYLVFGQNKAWILIPVALLACLPVTSFVLLQFPLLVDVISSTYGGGIFGKQSDRSFY